MTRAPRRRRAVVQPECLEDLRFWVDTNRKTALRVLDLIEAVLRDPYAGIGKPEHLKQLGGNVWSRRINDADRLVYEVFDDRPESPSTLSLLALATGCRGLTSIRLQPQFSQDKRVLPVPRPRAGIPRL